MLIPDLGDRSSGTAKRNKSAFLGKTSKISLKLLTSNASTEVPGRNYLISNIIRTLQIGNDWFDERQGGLSRFYSELLRHLPANQVEVTGMVVGTGQVERSSKGVVTAFALPENLLLGRLIRGRRTALKHLHTHRTDLIASHFALYALPLADQLRNMPFVTHFHGPWAAEAKAEGNSILASRIRVAVERCVYSRANRLIVLSYAFKEELITHYGISDKIIRVVPGGVDLERFNIALSRNQAREQLGWSAERFIVLAVRRQMRRMGLEQLIDASRALVKKHPNVLLLLAGSGPLASELRLRIAAYGLNDHVKLLGRIDDVQLPLAYRGADLTVVPSQSLEGFGMITLESLASGTPVFVTPVGGLPEVVRPFAPQCIFEGTAAGYLQAGLDEALCGHRALPSDAACRQYASERFSWSIVSTQIREVYDEVLSS